MATEIIFKMLNIAVLPAWLLLIFYPAKSITQKWIYSHAYPLLLAVVYAVFIMWGMVENYGSDGGMNSLQALRKGFENDKILLAAWAHYLVFDMLVGSYIARDALSKNLSKIMVSICLAFTLMLGPVGFLLYKLYLRLANQNQTQTL
jgi:hypothetical protein